MQHMSMRKISWRMSCYHPSWQHLHSARPHYYCTGYSKFLMFSVCVLAQLSVATTNSSPPIPTTVALSPAQSQTTPRGVHLLYVMHYYNIPVVIHEVSQIFYKFTTFKCFACTDLFKKNWKLSEMCHSATRHHMNIYYAPSFKATLNFFSRVWRLKIYALQPPGDTTDHQGHSSFRPLWPCIMNVGWRERNQQDATNLMFIIKLLS